MGNSQSNIYQPNYKKIKIIDKNKRIERGENWLCSWTHTFIDFELDEYINYHDGSSKKLSFDISMGEMNEGSDKEFFEQVAIGDYLEIDLNAVKGKKKDYSFYFYCGVLKGVERVRADGSFLRDTLEFFDEMGRNRERYQASIVDARTSNYANLRQTSYDMPPKW